MTICVGILCTDGVVIAADSMMSNKILGMSNQKAYEFPFGIGAIAGGDYLGKFFAHNLSNSTFNFQSSKDPYSFIQPMANLVINQIIEANPGIQPQLNQMMLNAQQRNEVFNFVNLCALVGFKLDNKFYLANFQPASFNSPFGACITKPEDRTFWQIIGSGYNTSAPLVSLLCDILNINGKPDITQGKVLAYWLVKYAIDNASGYVGGDVDILEMVNNNTEVGLGFAINRVDFQECEELKGDLMRHIKSYSSANNNSPSIPNV